MANRFLFLGSEGPRIFDDEKEYPDNLPGFLGITKQMGVLSEGEITWFDQTGPGSFLISDWKEKQLDDGEAERLAPKLFANPTQGTLTFFFGDIDKLGIIYTAPSASQAYILEDPRNGFSTSKGNSGTINIYWSSNNSRFEIENQLGNASVTNYLAFANVS